MRLRTGHGLRRAQLAGAAFAFFAALGVGCAGGQSGNEGDLPSAPCAGQGALLEAVITDIGGGCVNLEVKTLARAGLPVTDSAGNSLFDGRAQPGDLLRGKLGRIYAYTHDFAIGEDVAALPGPWGDQLEFQLMPMTGERIDIQWGRARTQSSLEELAAPDCDARLRSRVDLGGDSQGDGSASTVASPPEDVPECGE